MRRWLGMLVIFTLSAVFLLIPVVPTLTGMASAAGPVKLEILDPRGELFTPPVQPINPRLSSLAGKKIGIMNNGKAGADAFQPHLEKALKAVAPRVQIRTWGIAYNAYPNKAKDLKALAEWSDGVIGLIGD